MKMSEKGLIELTSLEGCCLKPYFDSVGVITIGVGATRSEIPDLAKWDKSKAITMKEVFSLLHKSIIKYEDAVNKALKNGAMVTQYQFDALVSICYNIGTGGLTGSTFMKKINAGSPLDDIGNAILMWDKPKEIIGRRTKEKNLFVKGVYSNTGYCQLFETDNKGHILWSKTRNIKIADYL